MTQVHCTRAQTSVLKALRQQSEPILAQALYTLIKQSQQIGLATVHRALDALKRMGRVLYFFGQRMACSPGYGLSVGAVHMSSQTIDTGPNCQDRLRTVRNIYLSHKGWLR